MNERAHKCREPDPVLEALPCDRPLPCEVHNKVEAESVANALEANLLAKESNKLLQEVVRLLFSIDERLGAMKPAPTPSKRRRRKS